MKYRILALFTLLLMMSPLCSEEIVGYWETVDQQTEKPDSIIAIYEYKGEYFGRIILTYDKEGKVDNSIYDKHSKATALVGDPYYAGLDLLWGLKKEGDVYKGGKIIDPTKGRIYEAEVWPEDGKLIVRGEILLFGRNDEWPKVLPKDFPSGFVLPDPKTFVPVIPQAK